MKESLGLQLSFFRMVSALFTSEHGSRKIMNAFSNFAISDRLSKANRKLTTRFSFIFCLPCIEVSVFAFPLTVAKDPETEVFTK